MLSEHRGGERGINDDDGDGKEEQGPRHDLGTSETGRP